MIKKVYDLVKRLATEHKLINSFKYDRLSKSAGTGEDVTPLVFLEMPIYYGKIEPMVGAIPCQFNVDIVLNPQALNNFNVEQLTDVTCQEIASQIAQQFIARMRNLFLNQESQVSVVSYSILTLQHWYDDKSYGVRLSVNANVVNEINFCMDDDYFDPDKQFTEIELLKDINTDDAEGCTPLSYKLPRIRL